MLKYKIIFIPNKNYSDVIDLFIIFQFKFGNIS